MSFPGQWTPGLPNAGMPLAIGGAAPGTLHSAADLQAAILEVCCRPPGWGPWPD